MTSLPPKKPDWLRVRLPTGADHARFLDVQRRLESADLPTVCHEARCPNIFECRSAGTATVMILGETCTRGCRFCAVNTGDPRGTVDPREPESTARAIEKMGLRYVVLTMVDRDDLLDGGAGHVAETVRRCKARSPELLVETLVGDFQGVRRDVRTIVREGAPDVYAHNVEVVPRLQRVIRDARCTWDRSVETLMAAKAEGARVTKTSLMVGIGEEEGEIYEAMELLRAADVDVLTIGQYLRPSPKHAEVKRYVEPAEFARYEEAGKALGFRFIASGPLVRSSYRAAEAFLDEQLRGAEDFDRYGRRLLPVLD